MSIKPENALIIFARQPVPGQVKTRLSPPLSTEEAAELYRCMLEDILARTESLAGLERYLFFEGGDDEAAYFARTSPGMARFPQEGDDLGARMAAAFHRVFADGHGIAVIIGTDSPDLPVTYIQDACELLQQGNIDVVFGPCDDGGYYLLGMGRLYGGLFRDITWSSGRVLRESLHRAADEKLRAALLPGWHDVDRPEDLLRPELLDMNNGAPRTREFICRWLEQGG